MSQQQWYFDSANDLGVGELVEIIIRHMMKSPAQQRGSDDKTSEETGYENAWCEFAACVQHEDGSHKGVSEGTLKALCLKMLEDMSDNNLVNLLEETEDGQRWSEADRAPSRKEMRAEVATELIRRVEIVANNYFWVNDDENAKTGRNSAKVDKIATPQDRF